MPAAKTSELPISGPGVAPVRIKEVEEAAAEYVKFRDRRMAATKKEVEHKTKLIDILHKHEKKIGRDQDGALNYRADNGDGTETFISLAPTGEALKVRAGVEDGGEE